MSRCRSAAAVVAVALILASCSGGASPSNGGAGDPASAAEIVSVLAATARQRVNVDNSFGGRTAFRTVSIVERLGVGARNGMVDTTSPGGRLLTTSEKDAIVASLSPMTVEATSMLWCGGTCGAGSTHVLAPTADGTWSVTGTTGSGFVA